MIVIFSALDLGAEKLNEIKIYNQDDFPGYLPKLNDLYDDLFAGGKGFRSQMVCTVGDAISLDKKAEALLCQTIEFIHNASLLHDDLIDRAPLRRSKTSAWLKYTPEYAVLAGDYLLARVMVNLSRFGNLNLIQYTAEIISDLLEGEWLQDSIISERDVSRESLDRVHQLKTASLFEWCIRAPFIAQENYDEKLHLLLSSIGKGLGVLFQRGDDLLDFDVRNDEGKKVLGDLAGGYLNSFGAHLIVGLSEEQRESLFQCRNMEAVYQVVGKEYFESRLENFDSENAMIIEKYKKDLTELAAFLPDGSEALIESFSPLAELLYWRKPH